MSVTFEDLAGLWPRDGRRKQEMQWESGQGQALRARGPHPRENRIPFTLGKLTALLPGTDTFIRCILGTNAESRTKAARWQVREGGKFKN